MFKLLKITETFIETTLRIPRRKIKMYNGASDTRKATAATHFGFDGNPPAGWIGIYARTEMDGKEVCIGLLNQGALAGVGESRTFALDGNGNVVAYMWHKADGTTEINGNDNNAVMFNELKTEFNKLQESHNDLVDKWNTFCTDYLPGSPVSTGTPKTLTTSEVDPNDSDIDKVKNPRIKTNTV